jgi:plastocyanin
LIPGAEPGERLIRHLIQEQLMPFLENLRRTLAFPVLAVLALALSPGASQAGIVTINIVSNDFVDPTTGVHVDPTINLGDTIRWNLASGVHDTQNQPGSVETWNSGLLLAPGTTFDHMFTHVGTFGYFCSVHSFPDASGQFVGMTATVTVVAVPEPGVILGISAVGMALGGWCSRRLRRSRS